MNTVPNFDFEPTFSPGNMVDPQEEEEKEMAETMRQNRERQEKLNMEFNFEPSSYPNLD